MEMVVVGAAGLVLAGGVLRDGECFLSGVRVVVVVVVLAGWRW